jgi:hypothetical protein
MVMETSCMKLDRELQRRVLTLMASKYPHSLSEEDYDDLVETCGEEALDSNLYYLMEHGLIDQGGSLPINGPVLINTDKLRCTAKGMDFLADDGGLGAILGTVTIKLHEETLRQLIEAKVQASDLPPDKKSGILKALREAPGDTTKQLITKLVDLGMENVPKAVPLIQTLLLGGQP